MIVVINDENVLISDLSKKQLDDTEVWTIDGFECSREEMIEYFKEKYTHIVDDEDLYKQGKEFLKKFYDYTEQDFNYHLRIYMVNEEECCTDFKCTPFMTDAMFYNGDVDEFLPMNVFVKDI